MICFDPFGKCYMADVQTRTNGQPEYDSDGNTRIDLPAIVEQYPEVRVIIVETLTDDVAACIAKCTAIETVVAERVQVTESGRRALRAVKTLQRICLKSGVEYSPDNVPVEIKAATE